MLCEKLVVGAADRCYYYVVRYHLFGVSRDVMEPRLLDDCPLDPIPLCNASRGLVTCQRGSVAVEFAIIGPLLAIILTAIIEIGLATAAWFTVQEAALAGANYASHKGFDASAISSAVISSTNKVQLTATPTPVSYCGCPSGTTIQTAGTICGGTCADGATVRRYVDVSASMGRPSVIGNNFGLPPTITVTLTTKVP